MPSIPIRLRCIDAAGVETVLVADRVVIEFGDEKEAEIRAFAGRGASIEIVTGHAIAEDRPHRLIVYPSAANHVRVEVAEY